MFLFMCLFSFHIYQNLVLNMKEIRIKNLIKYLGQADMLCLAIAKSKCVVSQDFTYFLKMGDLKHI